MAWNIEHTVIRGEISNRKRGRVEGRIWLAGQSDPLILRLAGNCLMDLAGRRLEFSNPEPLEDPSIILSPNQNGAVGEMTTERKAPVIKPFDYDAINVRQKQPGRLVNSLYLEWFSETDGRVVIESPEYRIKVSGPAWRMSCAEEQRQRKANAKAMQSYLDHVAGPPDAREEAAFNGLPRNEFEWELYLRAVDRRGIKLGELLEKHLYSPDRLLLVAKGMGWTEFATMLEEDAEPETEEELERTDEFSDFDAVKREDESFSHPLVARLFDRSTTLVKIVEDTGDRNLGEIVARFLAVGLKVSEALGGASRDRDEMSLFNGLVVAQLKRAMDELSRLLNMANRFKERGVQLPVSIDEWIGELLEIREELLLLMNEYRKA